MFKRTFIFLLTLFTLAIGQTGHDNWLHWNNWLSRSRGLIPTKSLALFVSPGTQMIDNARANKKYPALVLGDNVVSNGDFHDFTFDYKSIGEPSPFYESDFSAGTDGWSNYIGLSAVDGNIDAVSDDNGTSYDYCLRLTSDGTNGTARAVRYFDIYIKKRQYIKVTGKVYIPSGQTVNGAKVSIGNMWNVVTITDTTGVWVNFDVELEYTDPYNKGGCNYIEIIGSNFDNSGDVIYWRDIKVQRVGMVAHWIFDDYYHTQEGTGKTILQDLSGNGHDLTASTGFDYTNQLTGSDPAYRGGDALEFDGVDDYFYIPAASATSFNPGTGDFSVFLNLNYQGNGVLSIKRSTSTNGFIFEILGGRLSARIGDGTNYIDIFGTTVFIQNSDYAVGVVWESSIQKVTFYVNGQVDNSTTTLGIGDISSPSDFKIGVNHTLANPKYTNNYISEVAYFNRALSATEVQELYGKAKGWTWDGNGSIQNNDFKQVINGGQLTQEVSTIDTIAYKEHLVSTTNDSVNYFGQVSSHTVTLGDGTWTYAAVQDLKNVDGIPNFVEDYSEGGAKYGDEVLIDGGFEYWSSTTDLTNWNEVGVSAGVLDVLQESNIVHNGSYSVKMKATGSDGSSDIFIRQIHTDIDSGAIYKVSFWSYYKVRTQGHGQIQVGDEDYSPVFNRDINNQESGWTYHEYYFVATDDFLRFRLYLRDETDGDIYYDDFSVVKVSNGNHGIAQGGLETGQPVSPYAWEFDGVDDYVDFGGINAVGTHPFIFAGWFKTTATNGTILARRQTTDNWYRVYINYNGSLRVELSYDYGNTTGNSHYVAFSSDNIVNDGNWHFFAIARDNNSDVRLWIDDIEQTTAVNFPETLDGLYTDTHFTIACFTTYVYDLFNGEIAPIIAYLFDGKDGRLSSMPSNYKQVYIDKIYKNTKRYFQ